MTPEIWMVTRALKEALRLPPPRAGVQRHLSTGGLGAEVIVVDEGSHDATAEIVRQHARRWPQLKLVVAERNAGKGAAVRLGMAAARGRYRGFSAADLSVPIDDLEKLLRPLHAVARGRNARRGLRGSQGD